MATVNIGSSSSYCDNCGLPASLLETGHYTNLGYSSRINGTPGCGEEWDDARLTTWYGGSAWEVIEHSFLLAEHIKELLRNHYWDQYPDEIKDKFSQAAMDKRWAGNW